MNVALLSERPRVPKREACPRAVASALVYIGVLTFAMLYLRTWLVSVSRVYELPALRAWMWAADGGAARLAWTFAAVGILVVVYLWSSCRSAKSGAVVLLHFGAAVVVLALQWALMAALRGIPDFTLTQLHP